MTPRAILPTALFLIALSATGTWAALDAAAREQEQDERRRTAQAVCMEVCVSCRQFCAPVVREAAVKSRRS